MALSDTWLRNLRSSPAISVSHFFKVCKTKTHIWGLKLFKQASNSSTNLQTLNSKTTRANVGLISICCSRLQITIEKYPVPCTAINFILWMCLLSFVCPHIWWILHYPEKKLFTKLMFKKKKQKLLLHVPYTWYSTVGTLLVVIISHRLLRPPTDCENTSHRLMNLTNKQKLPATDYNQSVVL